MHPAKYFKQHYTACWYFVFTLLACPFFVLLYEYNTDSLGINPLERLTDVTGIWALNIFLLSLAITPSRHFLCYLMIKFRVSYGKRMSDWNFMIKLRRMIGLYSFFYACLHVLVFLWLDQGFEWRWILEEMLEKPYIFAGATAFLLLIPVAVTSNNSSIRRLGTNWRKLHRLVYPIGILVAVHFVWLSKAGVYDAWWYAITLSILLLSRLYIYNHYLLKRSNDNGMEVAERA